MKFVSQGVQYQNGDSCMTGYQQFVREWWAKNGVHLRGEKDKQKRKQNMAAAARAISQEWRASGRFKDSANKKKKKK